MCCIKHCLWSFSELFCAPFQRSVSSSLNVCLRALSKGFFAFLKRLFAPPCCKHLCHVPWTYFYAPLQRVVSRSLNVCFWSLACLSCVCVCHVCVSRTCLSCVTVLVPLACTSHVYVCFTTVCASHMCVCRVCASRACLSFVSTMCVCLSCVSHVCASHVCICHVLCTSHMCLACTRTHPLEQSHPHMHTLLHPRVFPVYYLRSYVGIFLLRLAHSHWTDSSTTRVSLSLYFK